MRYIATTYYIDEKYHSHTLVNGKIENCIKSHKKIKPLTHRLAPYLIAYLVGVATPIIIKLINLWTANTNVQLIAEKKTNVLVKT